LIFPARFCTGTCVKNAKQNGDGMRFHRIRLLVASGLYLALALPAQADDAPAGPVQSPVPQNQASLRFAPAQGEQRVIRLHAVQMGMHVGLKSKSVFRQVVALDTAYEVLAPTIEGRVRLRSTIRAARYQREIDGKNVASYDSSKPTKTLDDNAETMSMLIGLSFVIQVNSDGTMGEVEEKDKIAEQMLDKMKVSAESRQYVRPAIVATLDGTAFKNLGNTFASYPAQLVALGASWPKRDVVSSDSNLIYDGTLTLAKREGLLSTLHVKSSMKPDPARPKGATVQPLTGTQTGYYLVEELTGWTRRAHLEQRWSFWVDEMGQFVTPKTKRARPVYMKMTFDVGTLETKAATP